MKARIIILLILIIATAGCAPRTHVKSVHFLENEHNDRTVVIVNKRPARGRTCWKHVGHWHCRRR